MSSKRLIAGDAVLFIRFHEHYIGLKCVIQFIFLLVTNHTQ